MRNKFWDGFQEKQQLPPAMLVVLVIFFLFFCCILVWAILPVNTEGPIPAPLHASTQANYAVEGDRVIPRINENIIQEVILDINPYATAAIANRMATLNANLQTSVPTMTLSLGDQQTATVMFLTEKPQLPTSTPFPAATQTSVPTPLSSPTELPTLIPTAVPTVFVPTVTPVPEQPQPGIQVIKKLASYDDHDSSGSITTGDDLWYQFKVNNTGNTGLSYVYADEISFNIPVTCPGSTLSAGKSMICTADTFHRVSVAEANAGKVNNWAFASGDYGGKQYTDTDGLTLVIQQDPVIQISKELRSYDDNDSSGGITLGDGLWYQFDVLNGGNVTLTDIGVSDDTFGMPVVCPETSLLPGDSTVCAATVSHVVTAAEVLAGEVSNTATASGGFNDARVTASDTLAISLSINLEKSLATYDDHDSSGTISYNDDLWYRFEVTNIGTVALNTISVTDNTFGIAVTCPVTTLGPGLSTLCTSTTAHTVTLAEANAGLVHNEATAAGQQVSGAMVSDKDAVDTVVAQNLSLSIDKSASPLSYDTVGQTIDYTFEVTNTGSATIFGPIQIEDDRTANESCPTGDLKPSDVMTCDASYTITQADLDAGSVVNSALANGTCPGGELVVSDPDTVTVSAVQNPDIQIAKSVASFVDHDASGNVTLGDELWYQFIVTNSGSVTLTSIAVTDNSFGLAVSCPVSSLAPGATATCAADTAHTVTLAESDAGQVVNTATATGYLGGTAFTGGDTEITLLTQSPGFQLANSLRNYIDNDASGSITFNDALNYQFTLTNTGNVTLSNLTVSDETFGIPVTCPTSSLTPAETTVCTASTAHIVTLAEANAGQVANSATASGDFGGTTYTDNDTLVTTIQQNRSLTLSKSGSPLTYTLAGQTITYTYQLQNSGNVTLDGPFAVTDSIIGTIEPCGTGPLAPGEATNCIAAYSATQADVDAGSITNIATVSGSGATSAPDSVTVNSVQSPALSLTKSADVGSYDTVGQVITYTYSIRNTGNVTLAGPFMIEDDIEGTFTNCASGPLAPGASTTCTATHPVTLTDLDAGSITNIATASGSGVTSASDSVTVNADQAPALALAKSANVTAYDNVGETILYTYTIENTGNVTLAGPFTMEDDVEGTLTDCAVGPLAPGAETTCTTAHIVTQADLDAGSITNTATVSGNGVASAPGSVTINADQTPALALAKSADVMTFDTIGEVITYTFEVSNTGNVTITGPITVDDDRTTDESCPAGDIAPGESLSCSATHAITQIDLDEGSITNTATASGMDPGGNPVTSEADSTTVTAVQYPSIQISKSLAFYDDNDASGTITLGDALWYQFNVSNDGNVTLSNVGVTDDTFAILVTCPSSTLAPSIDMICLADTSHTVALLEAEAGQIANTATAAGEFDEGPFTGSDTLVTGVFPPTLSSEISGQVRDDADGDGVFSDPDAGLSNVSIELYNGFCTLGLDCPSTKTNVNGTFTFYSVPDGSYTLFETDLAQYLSTADSDPPNDNQINVIVSGGVGSSNNVFLDRVDPAACSDPDPVSGFVLSSNPADGETGIPISTAALSVTFNSPMLTSGAGNVLDKINFRSNIDNLTLGGDVPILSVRYEASTNTAFLTIDTSDPQWQRGSEYRMQVKSVIRNACGVKQDLDVNIHFTTEP